MGIQHDHSVPWCDRFDGFAAEKAVGDHFAQEAAAILRTAGVEVSVGGSNGLDGLRAPDDYAAIADYAADNQDAFVAGGLTEIKSRDLAFTTPSDFPHDDGIFVDTVESFEKKRVKPLRYIFISQHTKRLLGLDVAPATWTMKKRFDRVRGIEVMFYVARIKALYDQETLIARLKESR